MSRPVNRGFTLVEMLVVIGIIAILAALLLPAINMAIRSARNAAIAVEVNQLASAIESYKQDKGDYPPNFRDLSVVARHIRKCYPKIDPTYFQAFMTRATPAVGSPTAIDEGESLVFWLSMTDTNPTYPFLSYLQPNPTTPIAPSPKRYYEFDQTRLASATADAVPSYQAKFCGESFYIYIDSRSYSTLTVNFSASPPTAQVYAYAEDSTTGVRPYWTDTAAMTAPPAATPSRDKFKPVNPSSFQIICAGQDGDYGAMAGIMDVKFYPSGLNYDPQGGDKDNITNFSDGRMLGDKIP